MLHAPHRSAVAAAILTCAGACVTVPPAPAPAPASSEAMARHPRATSVCWLETASVDAPGLVAETGLDTPETWHATASALLVKHEDGEILIDSGASPHLDKDLSEVDDWSAFLIKYNSGLMPRRALLADALRAAGSDRSKLRILLSHAHPDHAGGLAEIEDVPVLLSAEELAFTQATAKAGGDDNILPAHARAMRNRAVALTFDDGPYQGFPRSADLFHDGSVVVVPLPGHTPGSVGTFVNLASGKRIFHIGDIALVLKAVDDNQPKGVLLSLITDVDRQGAADAQALVARVHKEDPAIVILPAHDRDQWAKAVAPKPPDVAAVCAP